MTVGRGSTLVVTALGSLLVPASPHGPGQPDLGCIGGKRQGHGQQPLTGVGTDAGDGQSSQSYWELVRAEVVPDRQTRRRGRPGIRGKPEALPEPSADELIEQGVDAEEEDTEPSRAW